MKRDDLLGFVAAALCTILPLLGVTCFMNGLSKDPVGPKVYVVPTVIGLAAAVNCLLLASRVPREQENRIAVCAGLGVFVSFGLVLSFCLWWGDWR